MKRVAIIALLTAACSLSLVSCEVPDYAKLPLTNAAVQGDTEKVKSLLASGEKVDAADANGMQAIHMVSLTGSGDSAEVLKILLAAGAKVDAVDKQGRQPIVFAVGAQAVKSVKVLLAAGANVNTTDNNGLQLIHLAAKTNSTEMVKVLLAAGALIDASDINGDRPLHWAARHGNTEMVKDLLVAGANPNAADRYGDQPLHWAARYGNYGNTEMIKILLAAGAKEDSLNKNGERPSAVAKHIGPTETDKGNGKGNLDEATLNYLENNIVPLLIRARLCSSSHSRDSCYGNKVMFCMQTNSLSCDLYGMSDENLVREISLSFQNSGLRIQKISFWHSTYDKKSVLEKPISRFDGHASER